MTEQMMRRARTRRIAGDRRHRRRGLTYAMFLGTALIVLVVGLAALTASRSRLQSAADHTDAENARLAAQSAMERGFRMIHADTSWRTTLGSGTWIDNAPFENGLMILEASFAGGNQASGDLTLIATGTSGQARHKLSVAVSSASGAEVISAGSWRQVVD
jgi:hypothetical protein